MNAQYSSETLAWLWQTTWQSVLLAAVVLLTTRILRRWLTPQVRQVLWLLVFLRLVMPSLPASRLSAFSWIQSEPSVESRAISMPRVIQTNTEPPIEYPTIMVSPSLPLSPAPVSRFQWSTVLLIFWLTVAAGIFGKVVVSNALFARRLKAQSRSCDRSTTELVAECCREMAINNPPAILITDAISTPSLHGAISPRLLLPTGLMSRIQPAELRLIILHELEHLRRRHLLVDWFLTAICSLHWFNPVAWQVHRCIRAARELICDRAVLANADDDSSRRYGLAMLEMATSAGRKNRSIQLAAFAAEQNDLQQRIEGIASRRRKYIVGLGAIVVITVAAVFLTRPAPPKPLAKAATPTTSPSKEAIDELVRVSRGLTEEHDYAHALQIIDRILELDPRNDYALGAKPRVEDRALIAQQRAYIEKYDALVYSRNRPDVAAARAATTQRMRQAEDNNKAVMAKLDRLLPEIKFDAVGFSDVVDFLRNVSSANIFVNWRALKDAGIDRDKPVNARLRDLKFSKALDIILREVGGEKVRLAYTVDEGVITISTADDLAGNVMTNVYDIRDLIVVASSQPSNQSAGQTTRQTLIKEIIRLIEDVVATDSWKDNGGKIGSIRELSAQLIVTQTPDNQRAIKQLLEQLRETRALQISVQARVVEMSDAKSDEMKKAYIEKMGLPQPLDGAKPHINGADLKVELFSAEHGGIPDTEIAKSVSVPQMVLFSGREASIEGKDGGLSADIKLRATFLSDLSAVTISVAGTAAADGVSLTLPPQAIKIENGAYALLRLMPSPSVESPDRLIWLELRPKIIIQRQSEQEQFPTAIRKPTQP